MAQFIRVDLSGERFSVVYRLAGDEPGARAMAQQICIDQSTEFPLDLTPEGDIRDSIVGHVESLVHVDPGHWDARISFAIETTGFELMQLLNIVFGVSSLKVGIRVERLDLPDSLLRKFNGPRFGLRGMRAHLGVEERPLLATALKPLGLPPRDLAEMAYRFALGGIDIIKDDHAIADVPFCPFAERVERCAEAVHRANRETGYRSAYAPTLPGPIDRLLQRALFAKSVGAGALLVSPGLAGFDAMRLLADDDRVALPLLYHCTLLGTFVIAEDVGISSYALRGQIGRLAGGDFVQTPYPSSPFGGSVAEAREVIAGCTDAMGHIRPTVPMPGGGVTLECVPEIVRFYGRDVVLLIGNGLYRDGPDLVANARAFRQTAEHAGTLAQTVRDEI